MMRNDRLAEQSGRKRREKRRMRRDIVFVQWFFILLFLAMGIFLCTYSFRYKRELFDNSYNSREEKMLAKNIRGKIFSSDGQVLAQSIQDESTGKQVRQYPYGNLFAQSVGYAVEGGSGIELAYNYDLVNSDLSLQEKAEADSKGELYQGNAVYSTLDTRLQKAASDALGSHKGAVIVSDPKTGAILAMVSKPDFDPETVEENWQRYLAEDPTVGRLLNRVTQGYYPPGSTFKIIDTIEYLKEHPDDWQNYSYTCTGDFIVDMEKIHCFHYEVHGQENLLQSFANSCNCSFANLGLSLDRSSWSATMKTLMFDEELPYDLPYVKSHVSLDSATSTKEVMQLSIGQGETAMSPLHMNMITNAVADNGTLMKPRLVSSVKTASGTSLKQQKAEQVGQMIDSQSAAEIRKMMRAVVTEGTASKLADASYEAAGKTGSAEYDANDESKSHAWFTGMAPVDDPKITVTVIVEGAGSGGDAAVPVAKEVFDAYFAM